MSSYRVIIDDHRDVIIFADYVVISEGVVEFMKENPYGTPHGTVAAFNEDSIVGWFEGE